MLILLHRCYYKAMENTAPEIVQQCLTFMQSEAVFLILSNLTGLSLHALAANNDSDSDVSDAGSYTELVPRDKSGKKVGASASKGIETNSSSGSDGEDDKKVKPKKKRRRLNSKSSEGERLADSSRDADVDDSIRTGELSGCRFLQVTVQFIQVHSLFGRI